MLILKTVRYKHDRISGNSTSLVLAFRGKNKLCNALAAAEVLRNMSHGLMRQISGRSRLLSFPSVPLSPLLNPYLSVLNPSLSVSLRFHLVWPLERESDANTAWSE